MTKPFLKWAGGKRELLSQYLDHFPSGVQNYYEPFLGGGAVFFGWGRGLAKNCILSDVNSALIQTYQVVRDHPHKLIRVLKEHELNYNSLISETDRKDYYLGVRSVNQQDLRPVEVAARFIFLNRTCYNGLYRESKRSGFNVPHGSNKASTPIARPEVLLEASQALQGVSIYSVDYTELTNFDYAKGDFVYMDPPYIPINSGSFTSYSSNDFKQEDHVNCAATFKALVGRGVRVALSNSDTPLSRDLYRGFKMIEVSSPRAINSKSNGRGKVAEILVLSD